MLVFPEPLLPIRRTFKKNSQDVTCTMMSQSQDFPISSIYRCKYLIIKIHKISEKYLLLHLDVLFHQFWLKTFRNYVNSRDSQTAWVLARKSCEDVRGCEKPAISLGQRNCVGITLCHVCKIEFYPKRKALSTVQNKDGSRPDDEAALNSNVCVENGKKWSRKST